MPNAEQLGPAERIIQTLTHHSDHMVHNRPGIVVQDGRTVTGVHWYPVTHKEEGDAKVVYKLLKGKPNVKMGVKHDNNDVVNDAGMVVGRYQSPGLFPEVAVWIYKQIAEVWKIDNEFAARWASYAWRQDHRDMKVALAAFMLCQSRKGEGVMEEGKLLFHDEDYRAVGEAMMLLTDKDYRMNPQMVILAHDLLRLPQIAEANRELGFGRSLRRPFLGRWEDVAKKWLKYREDNLPMLQGLAKKGQNRTVRRLAIQSRFKPSTATFFELFRWRQRQADEGHRTVAIGAELKGAESWDGLSEVQICERIVKDKPDYKRITGMLPAVPGLTRAIMAAAIEAGSLSDKDLVILTPTLEELGLLQVQDVRERWQAALKAAEDMRAANIARNVKSEDAKEQLEQAADEAVQEAVEEVVRNIRTYFIIDRSYSMSAALPLAMGYVEKFLQAFPLDQLHVAVFNETGNEVRIKHASAAGVRNAFRGIQAGGGTDYSAGVRALQHHLPKDDEDVLMFWIGDELNFNRENVPFEDAVQRSGLRPMAFGLVHIGDAGQFGANGRCVQSTASNLGIPCFQVDTETFQDPYAIPRTIRNLVAATPVGQPVGRQAAPRVTLVDTILKTELLQPPVWAAA